MEIARDGWPLRSNPAIVVSNSVGKTAIEREATFQIPRKPLPAENSIAQKRHLSRLDPLSSSQHEWRLFGGSGLILGSVNPRTRGQRSDFHKCFSDQDSWILGSTQPRQRAYRSNSGQRVHGREVGIRQSPDRSHNKANLYCQKGTTNPNWPLSNSHAQPGARTSRMREHRQSREMLDRVSSAFGSHVQAVLGPRTAYYSRQNPIPKNARYYGNLSGLEPRSSHEPLGKISKRSRWVQERTIRQNNILKLRKRAIRLSGLDETVGHPRMQSQAVTGEFLPQTWSDQQGPRKPKVDRQAGSLKRRQIHQLRCRHLVQTKNPTPCARNCTCDTVTPLSPHFLDKEHPCAQCVANRITNDYDQETKLLKLYRSFLKDLVFDGHLHLETARSEMSRWEAMFGRVWVAQMRQRQCSNLINDAVALGMDRNSFVYTREMDSMASFQGIPNMKRLSDYRGHDRFCGMVNIDLNGKGNKQNRKRKERQVAFDLAHKRSRSFDAE